MPTPGGRPNANTRTVQFPRPTLQTISDLTGVHTSTISRILRGRPQRVGEATRQRVLQVAAEIGYRPDLAGQALATRRSFAFGLIVPDLKDPVFAHISAGAEARAASDGYHVLLAPMSGAGESQRMRLELLFQRGVDGVIDATASYGDSRLTAAVRDATLPYVQVNRFGPSAVPHVVGDDEVGGLLATTHLLELGHRAIGFIGGTASATTTAGRLAGYRRGFERHGIGVDESFVTTGSFDVLSGSDGARRILDGDRRPTALFVADDTMALGAMRVLWERGLRVPDDFSIVGYNDLPYASVATPALTTVRIDLQRMGWQAANLLLALLDADESGETPTLAEVLPPKLVVRETTAPPP